MQEDVWEHLKKVNALHIKRDIMIFRVVANLGSHFIIFTDLRIVNCAQ